MILLVLQRGKKVPEGLTSAEEISKFEQIASHPVSPAHCFHCVTAIGLFSCSKRLQQAHIVKWTSGFFPPPFPFWGGGGWFFFSFLVDSVSQVDLG